MNVDSENRMYNVKVSIVCFQYYFQCDTFKLCATITLIHTDSHWNEKVIMNREL